MLAVQPQLGTSVGSTFRAMFLHEQLCHLTIRKQVRRTTPCRILLTMYERPGQSMSMSDIELIVYPVHLLLDRLVLYSLMVVQGQ